jgi:hypothetical protein
MGGLLLSTAVMAAATQENPSQTPKATVQEISPQEKLKLLKEIHSYNEVFDNYHTGGIPYEPSATIKGK